MATSGTFTGSRGGNSTGPYLELAWSRLEVDIPNNRSKIRLTLRLVSDYSLYFSDSKTGKLHTSSFTYTGGFSGTGTKTIKTLDVWVTHNSDGSKSQGFSAYLNIDVSWGGSKLSSLSVSGTAVIDSIPRASDFTAFTLTNTVLNVSTGTTINYTLGRKSTSFSQYMTLKLGSRVIKTWSTSGTGALTQSLTASEVNTIISALPNSASGTLTLTMQTKSGSRNIGSPKSINETFTLNSAIKPTASGLSVSIYGSGRDKTIGKYVQSISKVTASFSRTAGYGARISSSTITVKRQSDNGNPQTISSNSGTTANPVTLSGTYIVTGTVKDSRGRTATVSTTITVESYAAPRISKFTANRSSPTTSVLNAITAAWSALGTSNPASLTVVGMDNKGTSTTLYSLTNSTVGSLNTTRTYTGQSDASSYTYTITITDSFGKKASAIATVGTSVVELTIAKGSGIGVGKVWERGSLDVSGDVFLEGDDELLRMDTETHGYQTWFRGGSRIGYIGFPSGGTNNLYLSNEADGKVSLITNGNYMNLLPDGSLQLNNNIVASPTQGKNIVASGIGGGIFLHEGQAVTLSKDIADCGHGIILVWSRYIPGTGVDNSNWSFTTIPKAWVTATSSGSRAIVPYGSQSFATKYFYINSQRVIGGHEQNDDSPNDNIVLRYVWEW